MSRHSHPAIADSQLRLRHRHQAAAVRVAEQYNSFGAAADHLVVRCLHVDNAVLVQAVRVVVLVTGAKAKHCVTGGRQQRAGIVNAEVAAWVTEDHGCLPGFASRRRPQHSTNQRTIGRHQANGLAGNLDPRIVLRQRPIVETEGSLSPEVRIQFLHAPHVRRSVRQSEHVAIVDTHEAVASQVVVVSFGAAFARDAIDSESPEHRRAAPVEPGGDL